MTTVSTPTLNYRSGKACHMLLIAFLLLFGIVIMVQLTDRQHQQQHQQQVGLHKARYLKENKHEHVTKNKQHANNSQQDPNEVEKNKILHKFDEEYENLYEDHASTGTNKRPQHQTQIPAPDHFLKQRTGRNVENDHEIGHFVTADEKGNQHDIYTFACAKCGSTSFFHSLYKIVHGKEWDYPSDSPWIQIITSDRWHKYSHNTFRSLEEKNHFKDVLRRKTTSSYWLIRDPRERLLSAFKSKITCDDKFHPDSWSSRRKIIKSLLIVADMWDDKSASSTDCLSLQDYLFAMKKVHEEGNQAKLNSHLRPQTAIFSELHISPDDVDVVTEIKAPNAAGRLFDTFGVEREYDDYPHHHSSGGAVLEVTAKQEDILKELTAEEYKLLGPFLSS